MGIVLNHSIKNSIWIYLGFFIGYVNLVILLPYTFTTSEIGLIRTLQSFAILLASFSQIGVPSVLLKFLPKLSDSKSSQISIIKKSFFLCLTSITIFTVLLFIMNNKLVYLFDDSSQLFAQHYYFSIPIFTSLTLISYLEAFQQSFYKTVFPKFLRDVGLRVLTFFSIVCSAYFNLSFTTFLIIFTSGYLLTLFFNFISSYSIFKERFSNFVTSNIKLDTSQIVTFGLFSILGTGGSMIVGQIDSLMVASITNLSSAGIYSIAFFIGLVVEIPNRALNQIINPLVSNAWKNFDVTYIHQIYKKTSATQLVIGAFIFLCIWINVDNIFSIIPNGDEFKPAKFVVFWIMLAKLFDMSCGANNEIIGYSKWYKFNVIALSLLVVLTFLTNLAFIPIFGLVGAAFASFLSYMVFNVFKLIFIQRKLKIHPFTFKSLLPISFLIMFILVNTYVVFSLNPYLDIVINLLFATALYLPFIYFLNISEDITAFIRSISHKLLKPKSH